ncbi:hypothetical protein [Staphylococcus chromogenes]|uniref:hypothetical protein n=1 Tax=Staphylococcus chromogenes TaxID=46126 RepID=UPI003AFF9099
MNENIFVHDTGYGLIQKSVMRNKNLSIEAKAIYSYFASVEEPTDKLLSEELNLSEKQVEFYKNELMDYFNTLEEN